jgi:hypothetical protein
MNLRKKFTQQQFFYISTDFDWWHTDWFSLTSGRTWEHQKFSKHNSRSTTGKLFLSFVFSFGAFFQITMCVITIIIPLAVLKDLLVWVLYKLRSKLLCLMKSHLVVNGLFTMCMTILKIVIVQTKINSLLLSIHVSTSFVILNTRVDTVFYYKVIILNSPVTVTHVIECIPKNFARVL